MHNYGIMLVSASYQGSWYIGTRTYTIHVCVSVYTATTDMQNGLLYNCENKRFINH